MKEKKDSLIHTQAGKQADEERSSAYTFLIVGGLGFILDILFALGILKLPITGYMKIIMSLFMGIVFFIFIVIGVLSYKKTFVLTSKAEKESDLTAEIKSWFYREFTREQIEALISNDNDSKDSEEQLYFTRTDIMKRTMELHFPGLEESFSDHLLEEIYTEYYPQ